MGIVDGDGKQTNDLDIQSSEGSKSVTTFTLSSTDTQKREDWTKITD